MKCLRVSHSERHTRHVLTCAGLLTTGIGHMKYFRYGLQFIIAILPSWLKLPLYRAFFGYEIGRGVRIGFSPIIGVRRLEIGDGTRIGWFNLFYRVDQVVIGRQVNVGFLNCFRGGQSIRIGDYCSILRLNTVNAIIDGDFISAVEQTLEIGAGAVVTTGHWLDFSAGIRIGDHVILGGRNSSLWTHNRQIGTPISLASHTYLGSEVRPLGAGRRGRAVLRRGPGLGAVGPVRPTSIVDRRQPRPGRAGTEPG